MDTSFKSTWNLGYGKIHKTNTPWFSRPPYHDRSAALRPTAHQIWQFSFFAKSEGIYTNLVMKYLYMCVCVCVCVCVRCFDGSQEHPSTGKGPSAPEVTLHTSRQNYPQYYIRIFWPVTRKPRNVGCETSGMLCSHMATSALTTNSAVR